MSRGFGSVIRSTARRASILSPMAPRRLRLAASSGAALALLGVWLGHTLEYARLAGLGGLRQELVGSVHWYMAPAGLALALGAAAGAVRAVRLWTALGRQLDWTRRAIAGAWRGKAGRPLPPAPVKRRPPVGLSLTGLWLALTTAQIGLYLVQENVEAAAAGLPRPGLGAVSGVHWAAPLIHAGVALLVSCAAVAVHRLLQRRTRAVDRTCALLRHLLAYLVRPSNWSTPRAQTVVRLVDRLGRLWCRPPPSLLTAG